MMENDWKSPDGADQHQIQIEMNDDIVGHHQNEVNTKNNNNFRSNKINLPDDQFEYPANSDNNKNQVFASLPIKVLLFSGFLLITGISLLIAGLVCLSESDDKSKTISFLAIGGSLSIPGIYYSIQLFQAYTAKTPEERQEILEDIPM